MKLVKKRVPPFAIGLVIGTILAIGLLSNWQKRREMTGVLYPVTEAHQAIGENKNWLNSFRFVRADELTGRILLLNFWSSSCVNCLSTLADLKKLEQEMGEDLVVIGIHSAKFTGEKEPETIAAAIRRSGIRHFVVNDADFKIWSKFGVRSWPTQILISPAGHIVDTFPGEGNFEKIKAAIQQVKVQFPGKPNSIPLPYEFLVGEGVGLQSPLRYPSKLAFCEGKLWISDSGKNRLVGVNIGSGEIQVEVGSGRPGLRDGEFSQAEFNQPQGMVCAQQKIWVADTMNHSIRELDLKSKTVRTIAGTGLHGKSIESKGVNARETALDYPRDLLITDSGRSLVIASAGSNQLLSYDFMRKSLRVLAGNGKEFMDDGPYPLNSLAQPSGLAEAHGKIYFVDAESSSLREMNRNGSVSTLVGTDLFTFGFADGKRDKSIMQMPLGLLADGGKIYIADTLNHAIRRYDPVTKILSTLTGKSGRGHQDGNLRDAKFFSPGDIKRVGKLFYIADTNNHAIRVLNLASGEVATMAIQERHADASLQAATYLPQLRAMADQNLRAGLQIPVELVLSGFFKINADAPSRILLFEDDGKKTKLIVEIGKSEVALQRLTLPPLVAGKKYRLQATFYFCRHGKESQCAMESRDFAISASHQSELEKITIPVGGEM